MVVRDAGWVDREYNREKWSELLDLAESLVADGERSMPRLLSLLELHQRNSWNRATTDSSPHASAAFAQLVNVPFTAAFEGFAGMVARTICNACRPETGCVVELGSGYGRFLFRVWLCGGPADAPYFAMEFTEAGRQCTRAIADLEPAIDMRVSPFDYNDPDYSVLPSGLGHAVVFSCQSIEQMPALKKEVLTGLFGVAREITCLHFEPVGWQLNEKDKTPGEGASSKAYAEENDYNRNLWPLLMELRDESQIKIDRAEADIFGVVPENCVSIIGWTKTD